MALTLPNFISPPWLSCFSSPRGPAPCGPGREKAGLPRGSGREKAGAPRGTRKRTRPRGPGREKAGGPFEPGARASEGRPGPRGARKRVASQGLGPRKRVAAHNFEPDRRTCIAARSACQLHATALSLSALPGCHCKLSGSSTPSCTP